MENTKSGKSRELLDNAARLKGIYKSRTVSKLPRIEKQSQQQSTQNVTNCLSFLSSLWIEAWWIHLLETTLKTMDLMAEKFLAVMEALPIWIPIQSALGKVFLARFLFRFYWFHQHCFHFVILDYFLNPDAFTPERFNHEHESDWCACPEGPARCVCPEGSRTFRC